MAYPHPTADTLADGTIHVLGLGFAIPATILLTTYAASQGEQLTPTLVYAACFVLSLLACEGHRRQGQRRRLKKKDWEGKVRMVKKRTKKDARMR